MSDNETLLLFDKALQSALGGETLDSLLEKHADAALRGDGERLRFLERALELAVTLGYHAVVADESRRGKH